MQIPQAPGIATPRYAFTREEAANVLGISPATIDRLTKRNLLRPSRATRWPLYSSQELQRFLRDTTVDLNAFEEGSLAAL
jgi:hypothetical protein